MLISYIATYKHVDMAPGHPGHLGNTEDAFTFSTKLLKFNKGLILLCNRFLV